MNEINSTPNVDNENRQMVDPDSLSNDQLLTLKGLWTEARNSSTPMGDLRSRMSDSGKFGFIDTYNLNNIELRRLAEAAESAESTVRVRRRSELEAILNAVRGKNTPVERLRALQDAGILKEGSGIQMSYEDINAFVRGAEEELGQLTRAETASDDGSADEAEAEVASAPEQASSTPEQTSSTDLELVDDALPEPSHPDGSSDSTESEADPEPEPVSSEDADLPLRVVTVNTSVDLRQAAIDFANKRLTSELNARGCFFKKLARNIWKGNVAKDYYRAKYARQAEVEMIESGNFLSKDATPGQLADARRALFDRFGLDFEEAVHDEAGESREVLSGNSEFAERSKELIRRYAEASDGSFNRASLDQEMNRLIREFSQGDNPVISGGDLMSASNLSEIAETVKGRVAHGQAIDNILNEMQFITGESRSGVRTGLHETNVDKLYDKLRSSKNSRLRAISPDTLLVASGIAASLAGIGGNRLTATMLSLVPGASGAFIAGRREYKRTGEDRIQHAREMAQGGSTENESKRRQEMEGARYETKKATDLTESLRLLNSDLLDDGTDRARAIDQALQGLANINTRISLGDSRGTDLISFSDVGSVGQERMELDIARAQLRAKLEELVGSLEADSRDAYGLGDADTSRLISERRDQFVDVIERDMSAKDSAFNKLRAKRVAKAAAIGMATGTVFGLIGQEVFAGFDDARQGLVEEMWDGRSGTVSSDGSIHQTMLSSWVRGEGALVIPSIYGGNMISDQFLATEGRMTAPEGISFRDDGNGLFTILDKNGAEVLTGLEVEVSGQISPDSLKLIEAEGFSVSEQPQTTITPGQDVEKEIIYDNPADYVRENGGTEVSGRSWADNNTPASVFDKNELRLWTDGTGDDGTVNATVRTMTEDGSYGQGDPVNWRETQAEGELVALITGSRGTQNWAFEIPINSDGSFSIPPDHPAHQLFEVQPGEDWEASENFKGAFIEIAQKTPNADGTIHAHMLATAVGGNEPPELREIITIPGEDVANTVFDYEIAPPADTQIATHTEMAPAIPVVGRRSMETLRNRREAPGRTPEAYYYRSQYGSAEELVDILDDLDEHGSPRLRDNPEAHLNLGDELDWFRQETRKQQGDAYVDTIERAIADSSELSGVSSGLESIVTIPVKASGKEESESIFGLLSAYGNQDPDALKGNMVLLHVNWPQSAMSDPESSARVRNTLSEIERARKAYPGLTIATIESQWTAEDLSGGVIGKVADRMRDAALLTLRRAIDEGRLSSDQEVQILRNDADAKGIHRNYLKQYHKSFNDNPETDVFTGTTRFDQRRAAELPGMVMGQNFASMLDILEAGRHGKVHTGGANFGVRASMLAAIGSVLSSSGDKGVGSDDVAIGRTISAARSRNVNYSGNYNRTSRLGGRKRRPSSSYYSHPVVVNLDRAVSKRIVGAQIDTDSQRSEEVYLLGGSFHDTWNSNFDEGGHRERGTASGSVDIVARREQLQRDLGLQLTRLESDVNRTVQVAGGVTNPAVKSALSLMFAGLKSGPGYRVRGSEVEFTADGHNYLMNAMKRDSRGRFDQYGRRLARQLYGEVSSGSRRVARATPPLISTS